LVESFFKWWFALATETTLPEAGTQIEVDKTQKKELYDLIVSGPEQNGFDCGVWNTAMINELILRKFGVHYNPRYLSTVLKKMSLSYQKTGVITDRIDEEHYR
jgi:transposase